MTETPDVSLREATLDDAPAVGALSRGLGLFAPEEPEAIRGAWEWLWTRNPTVTSGLMPGVPGWVLRAGGEIVGFFGTIPRRYRFAGETVRVAVATNWAVQRAFRTHTNELARAYFGQAGADLWLVNTAIKPAERIFVRFGAVPMPQRDYTRVQYWVLNAAGFLRSGLRKLNARPWVTAAGGAALSPFLAAALALRRRPGRLRAGLEPEALPLAAAGDEFDDLWRRKEGESGPPVFYASRTAQDLRWHFGLAAQRDAATVLCCRRGGRLDGYLVLVRDHTPAIGLHRARIADLLVAGNDPAVVDALLAAACEAAAAQGCHVLELVGLPRELRARVALYRPFTRMLPTTPFHYRTAVQPLATALQREESWYPTFYDGDSSLG